MASSEQAEQKKVAIKGGCHCGIIRYTALVVPNPNNNTLTATRCNCTFCQKLGSTNLKIASPDDDFTLHSPASRSGLGDYAPRVKTVHRYFCRECGTHVWMEGAYPYEGQMYPFFALNLGTVDVPMECGIDLSRTEIRYHDMLRDNVKGGLRDTPYEDGLV